MWGVKQPARIQRHVLGSPFMVSSRVTLGHEPGLLGMRVDHPDDRVAHAHPDDRDARAQKWSHALKTREPWEDTYRIRGAAGEYRWSPMSNVGGAETWMRDS